MAIDADVHSAKQWELAIGEETALGTEQTTAGNFKLLHVTRHGSVNLTGLIRDATRRARGQRVKHNQDVYFTKASGEVSLPFECIATDITLDYLLYLVMQDLVGEASPTPFAKVLEWDAATVQPDFAAISGPASAGKLVTVLQRGPVASEHRRLSSAILRNLVLRLDPGLNGGRLTCEGVFWSGMSNSFSPSQNQSITGATQPGTDYYHFARLVSKSLAGNDMVLGGFELRLDNRVARVGSDSSGDAQAYALGVPGYAATGVISVKYDDNSKDTIDSFLTSAYDTQLVLAWGSGADPVTTDGDLLLKLNVNFAGNAFDFGREDGVFLTIPFECVDDGSNEAVEIEIANATDRAWT
ncbi:MAG: hypothetical protein V3U35_03475 [Candidatus Neomarinimicrobiota bacterium]